MPFDHRLRTVSRLATADVLISGLIVCLIANWPGQLSYDAEMQLLEGRQAIYANWHPYVMSWLLGVFDSILPGTGLFVSFTILLLFGSLISLLWLPGRASWTAVGAAVFCIASPQFFLYPGIVWIDVLFAALATASYVCLALAAAHWSAVNRRFMLLGLCILYLSFASQVRQNGVVLLLPMLITLGWIASRHGTWRDGVLYGVTAAAVVIVVSLTTLTLLGPRIRGQAGPTAQIRLLQTYDIIGALKSAPSYPLHAIASHDPLLAEQLRREGVDLYSAERNDTLSDSKTLQTGLDHANPGAIAMQWRDLVLRHTGLYLRVRRGVFFWVFLTPNLEACVPYMAGVDGPPGLLRALGIAERMDAGDAMLKRYGDMFVGTPFLSHGAAALLAIFELIFLYRRSRDADIAVAALLASGLIFTLTFFVIAIACDYRYLYFLDVAAMVSMFYITLDFPVLSRENTG